MDDSSLFLTSILIASAGEVYSPGGLLVSGGRVLFCGDRQSATLYAPAGTKKRDLAGTVIFPGFVNAHTHLTIPPLEGHQEGDFVGWLLGVMRLRGEAGRDETADCVRESLRQCAESGITLAGEISGGDLHFYDGARIRLRVYLELLGMTRERWREMGEHIESSLPLFEEGGDRLRPGLSPHALYSVSEEAILWAKTLSGDRKLPLQMHFAESLPELDYIRSGGGEVKERIYSAFGINDGGFQGYGDGYVDLVMDSLPFGTALVHGTYLSEEELTSLGKAGFPFVFCIRSNKFLTGALPKLDAIVDRGYPFAIGTDSRGSCKKIDMFEELRSAADAYHGSLKAKAFYPRLFDGATKGGADILGFGDICGTLSGGMMADFCALEISSDKGRIHSDLIEKGEGKKIALVCVSGDSLFGF